MRIQKPREFSTPDTIPLHPQTADRNPDLTVIARKKSKNRDTGMTYQVWQTQWNQAMESLVRAYQAMASTHEANTLAMYAQDAAEAARWGG